MIIPFLAITAISAFTIISAETVGDATKSQTSSSLTSDTNTVKTMVHNKPPRNKEIAVAPIIAVTSETQEVTPNPTDIRSISLQTKKKDTLIETPYSTARSEMKFGKDDENATDWMK